MRMHVIVFMILAAVSSACALEFSLIQKENNASDHTLLVIGGIQGDEPGGFNAAAVLATHYEITKGNVWIVPNLNFYSIIKRSRGVYGDMNRKFATLAQSDPEFDTVRKIRNIITDERVDLIVNLHDGSGFYRERYVDGKRNQHRWGQSCIIDQETIDAERFGNLREIADFVVGNVNERLVDPEHRYSVKNTRTRDGNVEMAKTLTYYAINNGKPAFGNEGSKEFGTHYRAYYHLLALEAYMDYMGIEYRRTFELTPETVERIIDYDYTITMFDKVRLPIKDTRKRLNYIPTDAKQPLYVSDNPLVCAVRDGKGGYMIHYGNRTVTKVSPQHFGYDDSLSGLELSVDGRKRHVELGETVEVNDSFNIPDRDGYRINVIGYSNGKQKETGVTIRRQDMPKRFSVDRYGNVFRVEIYKQEKFSGMFLVKFCEQGAQTTVSAESKTDPRPRS